MPIYSGTWRARVEQEYEIEADSDAEFERAIQEEMSPRNVVELLDFDYDQNERQEPLYPDVKVQLTGIDSNAGTIIAAVTDALKAWFCEQGASPSEAVKEFRAEATSGDYDNVIQTAMRWVEVS